jgi:hypothetical protein
VATVAVHWQTLVLLSLLLVAWVAWWLWAVNWVHAWDWLGRGAWVAVALLVFLGALVWSQISPRDLYVGFTFLPASWWHLVATALLAGLALFCGWLQGVMGWVPADIPVYPADDAHDDTHGHEQFHASEPQADENGHGGHGGHH